LIRIAPAQFCAGGSPANDNLAHSAMASPLSRGNLYAHTPTVTGNMSPNCVIGPTTSSELYTIIRRHTDAQAGLVTLAQLRRDGVSADIVERRAKAGWLQRVHVGVYQLGPIAAPRAREFAAILACGGGVISHATAAALSDMLPAQRATEPVDLTLPRGSRCGRRQGIRVHRAALAAADIRSIGQLQLTSAARTLLDIGTIVSPRDLERAFAAAERSFAGTRDAVVALLAREPRARGIRALRRLLAASGDGGFTCSEAEERFLLLLRRSGLPRPEVNVRVHGFEVDFYWRREGVVVEVDGYAYHSSRPDFESDRRRNSALASAGIMVIRLSWRQIDREPDKTLVQVAQALARAKS
jgi:very-short-patch-repair endonuclease